MTTQNESTDPTIGGWRETLLSVAELDHWVTFYTQFDAWKIIYEGPVTAQRLAHMEIPKGIGAHEILVGHGDARHGNVRLIRFDNAPGNPVIRSVGRPWETGGWFDLNVFVDNLKERCAQFRHLGWSDVSDPILYDFKSRTVKEWLAFGADGVVLALVERVHPPLERQLQPGMFGQHTNSTQIVDDFNAARSFYIDLLGFKPDLEIIDEPMQPEPGPNLLGFPEELAANQRWNVSVLKASGPEGGNIEIVSLPGASGRNFAGLANPPNRGIISHLFPVDCIGNLHQKLMRAGVEIIKPPAQINLPPDGDTQLMTVRRPDGVRLDFYANC
jgi:catechol 2,3-dioxygenase-like lactoylglutathione lyase family enzyme